MRNVVLRLALAVGALTLSVQAGSAAGNRVLPFWAQPYPSSYAYDRRPAEQDPCLAWVDVNTLFGVRRERVWVCDRVVTSRY